MKKEESCNHVRKTLGGTNDLQAQQDVQNSVLAQISDTVLERLGDPPSSPSHPLGVWKDLQDARLESLQTLSAQAAARTHFPPSR